MSNSPFSKLAETIFDYFPNLIAGVILIGLGLVAGWIVKRVVFQACVILRLERLLRSFRWGEGFARADIRHPLFNSIGNVAFLLVFLVFLNAAFAAMQLTVLSTLIERSVSVIPRLIVAVFIIWIGWLIARWVSHTIRRSLAKEGVPRATLIARFSNAVVLLFFSAMALVELDVAREIVVIGFSAIIITLGVLSVTVVLLGGRELAKKTLASFEEEPEQPRGRRKRALPTKR